MLSVDVFAVGFSAESSDWEKICSRAYSLDKADFLENGYPTKTAGGPSTSSKRVLRSSQESPAKRKAAQVEYISTDDEEGDSEGDDDVDVGIEGMLTPTGRSTDVPGSSASSMLPPMSQTPRTPTPTGRPQKKRKTEEMTIFVKEMAELQKSTAKSLEAMQRQVELADKRTEAALAQIRADNASERALNAEMHRRNTDWMREESQKNRELIQLLMQRVGVQPLAQLEPATQSPPLMLQGQPSTSNVSNASSPAQPQDACPPLPVAEPGPVPNPPAEEAPEAIEDIMVDVVEGVAAKDDVEIGHNLLVEPSEPTRQAHDEPHEDPPAGCAQ